MHLLDPVPVRNGNPSAPPKILSACLPGEMKRALSPLSPAAAVMRPPTAAKKFRFDSFAEEFESKENKNNNDNDSGIGELKKEARNG